MRTLIHISLLVLLCSSSYAQSTNFASKDDWRRTKQELILGLGATNFLGDLGGLDQIGTDYSIVDIEWQLTRPSIYLGYRNRLNKNISVRSMFHWGMVKGDDQLTQETFRNYRNLHFRSSTWELSQSIEFGISIEKIGQRYDVAKGFNNFSSYLYGFIGAGVMFFNPKAELGGKWVALQPLGTEGQVAADTLKKYSRFTYTIPIGVGFRFMLSKRINLGIEVAYRKTGSDYIDDVSTDYYDNALIQAVQGDDAAYLADPSSGVNENWTIHGEQRGDPDEKDAILTAHLMVSYNLTGFNNLGGKRKNNVRKRRKGIKRRYRAMF